MGHFIKTLILHCHSALSKPINSINPDTFVPIDAALVNPQPGGAYFDCTSCGKDQACCEAHPPVNRPDLASDINAFWGCTTLRNECVAYPIKDCNACNVLDMNFGDWREAKDCCVGTTGRFDNADRRTAGMDSVCVWDPVLTLPKGQSVLAVAQSFDIIDPTEAFDTWEDLDRGMNGAELGVCYSSKCADCGENPLCCHNVDQIKGGDYCLWDIEEDETGKSEGSCKQLCGSCNKIADDFQRQQCCRELDCVVDDSQSPPICMEAPLECWECNGFDESMIGNCCDTMQHHSACLALTNSSGFGPLLKCHEINQCSDCNKLGISRDVEECCTVAEGKGVGCEFSLEGFDEGNMCQPKKLVADCPTNDYHCKTPCDVCNTASELPFVESCCNSQPKCYFDDKSIDFTSQTSSDPSVPRRPCTPLPNDCHECVLSETCCHELGDACIFMTDSNLTREVWGDVLPRPSNGRPHGELDAHAYAFNDGRTGPGLGGRGDTGHSAYQGYELSIQTCQVRPKTCDKCRTQDCCDAMVLSDDPLCMWLPSYDSVARAPWETFYNPLFNMASRPDGKPLWSGASLVGGSGNEGRCLDMPIDCNACNHLQIQEHAEEEMIGARETIINSHTKSAYDPKNWHGSYTDFKFNPGIYKRRLQSLHESTGSPTDEFDQAVDHDSIISGFKIGFGSMVERGFIDRERRRLAHKDQVQIDLNRADSPFSKEDDEVDEYRRRRLQDLRKSTTKTPVIIPFGEDVKCETFSKDGANVRNCNIDEGSLARAINTNSGKILEGFGYDNDMYQYRTWVDSEGNYHRNRTNLAKVRNEVFYPFWDDSNVFMKMFPMKPWYSAKYYSFNPKKQPGEYVKNNSMAGMHGDRKDPMDEHLPGKRWNLAARCCDLMSTTRGCQTNTWDDFIVDGKNLSFDYSKRLGYFEGILPQNLLGAHRVTENVDIRWETDNEHLPWYMQQSKLAENKDSLDLIMSPYHAGHQPTPFRCLNLPDKCEDNAQFHSCTDAGALLGCNWSATHEWDPSGKWSAYRMTGDVHDEADWCDSKQMMETPGARDAQGWETADSQHHNREYTLENDASYARNPNRAIRPGSQEGRICEGESPLFGSWHKTRSSNIMGTGAMDNFMINLQGSQLGLDGKPTFKWSKHMDSPNINPAYSAWVPSLSQSFAGHRMNDDGYFLFGGGPMYDRNFYNGGVCRPMSCLDYGLLDCDICVKCNDSPFPERCCGLQDSCAFVGGECLEIPETCESCKVSPDEEECCMEVTGYSDPDGQFSNECIFVDGNCISKPEHISGGGIGTGGEFGTILIEVDAGGGGNSCDWCMRNEVNDKFGCCEALSADCSWTHRGGQAMCVDKCTGETSQGGCESHLPDCMWNRLYETCQRLPDRCFQCNDSITFQGFDVREQCCGLVDSEPYGCMYLDNKCMDRPLTCTDCNYKDGNQPRLGLTQDCCDQMATFGCMFNFDLGDCHSRHDQCQQCNDATVYAAEIESELCCNSIATGGMIDKAGCYYDPLKGRDGVGDRGCSVKPLHGFCDYCMEIECCDALEECMWMDDWYKSVPHVLPGVGKYCLPKPLTCKECDHWDCCHQMDQCAWSGRYCIDAPRDCQSPCLQADGSADKECCESIGWDLGCIYVEDNDASPPTSYCTDLIPKGSIPTHRNIIDGGGFGGEIGRGCALCDGDEECCNVAMQWVGCEWDGIDLCVGPNVPRCTNCMDYEHPDLCCELLLDHCLWNGNPAIPGSQECVDRPERCMDCAATNDEYDCCRSLDRECVLIDLDCVDRPIDCDQCNSPFTMGKEACCEEIADMCRWNDNAAACTPKCQGITTQEDCRKDPHHCYWVDDYCKEVPDRCYECNDITHDTVDCCVLTKDKCMIAENGTECKDLPPTCPDCNAYKPFDVECCENMVGAGCHYFEASQACGSIINNCDHCNEAHITLGEECCNSPGSCFWNSSVDTCFDKPTTCEDCRYSGGQDCCDALDCLWTTRHECIAPPHGGCAGCEGNGECCEAMGDCIFVGGAGGGSNSIGVLDRSCQMKPIDCEGCGASRECCNAMEDECFYMGSECLDPPPSCVDCVNEECCLLVANYLGCDWNSNTFNCDETIVECQQCMAYGEHADQCCNRRPEECMYVGLECVEIPPSCEGCAATPDERECCDEMANCALVDMECIPTPECWHCNQDSVADMEACCNELTPICGWFPDGALCSNICSSFPTKDCCEENLPHCFWIDGTDECGETPPECFECNKYPENVSECCVLVSNDCILLEDECKPMPPTCPDCNEYEYAVEECCDQLAAIGCEYSPIDEACGSIIPECPLCNDNEKPEQCCHSLGSDCYYNPDSETCNWKPVCKDQDCCLACDNEWCCKHFDSPVKCSWLGDQTCETRPESCSDCDSELCCLGWLDGLGHKCHWLDTPSMNEKQTQCVEIEKCEDCEGSEQCCKTMGKDKGCIFAGNWYDHTFDPNPDPMSPKDPSEDGGFIQECFSPPDQCRQCTTEFCCNSVADWLSCDWEGEYCNPVNPPDICKKCNHSEFPQLCCEGREDECMYLDAATGTMCIERPQICTGCIETLNEKQCCELLSTDKMDCLWADGNCNMPQECGFCNDLDRWDPKSCCEEQGDACCYTDDNKCVDKCQSCNDEHTADPEACCFNLTPLCGWFSEDGHLNGGIIPPKECFSVPDSCWECNQYDFGDRETCCVLMPGQCEWNYNERECLDKPEGCKDCNAFVNCPTCIDDCCEFVNENGEIPGMCDYDGESCSTNDCTKCKDALNPEFCCDHASECWWNINWQECWNVPSECPECQTEECCEGANEQTDVECAWIGKECVVPPKECGLCGGNKDCCDAIMVDVGCAWAGDMCIDIPESCEDCNFDWACCESISDQLGCVWEMPMCIPPRECDRCNFFEDPKRCCDALDERPPNPPDCLFVGSICIDRPDNCWECTVSPHEEECCGMMVDCIFLDEECQPNPGGCRICDFYEDPKACCENMHDETGCIFVDRHCIEPPEECAKCNLYDDPQECCEWMAEAGCQFEDGECHDVPDLCLECNWTHLLDYAARERCCHSYLDCMFNENVCVPFPKVCSDCWQYPDRYSCCDDTSQALQCITIGKGENEVCDSRTDECGECNVSKKPVSCCLNRDNCEFNPDMVCIDKVPHPPVTPPTCDSCVSLTGWDKILCCTMFKDDDTCDPSVCIPEISLPDACGGCKPLADNSLTDISEQQCCDQVTGLLDCWWKPSDFPMPGLIAACVDKPDQCQECDGYGTDGAEACCSALGHDMGCTWDPDTSSCGDGIDLCQDCITEECCQKHDPLEKECIWVDGQCNEKEPIDCYDCNWAQWENFNLDKCCYGRHDVGCIVLPRPSGPPDRECVRIPEQCPDCNDTADPQLCCDLLQPVIGCDWIDESCVDPPKECIECNYYIMQEWCCQQNDDCLFYQTDDGREACDIKKPDCDDYNDLDNMPIACASNAGCYMEMGRCWNIDNKYQCEVPGAARNDNEMIASASAGILILILGMIWAWLITHWKLPYQAKNAFTHDPENDYHVDDRAAMMPDMQSAAMLGDMEAPFFPAITLNTMASEGGRGQTRSDFAPISIDAPISIGASSFTDELITDSLLDSTEQPPSTVSMDSDHRSIGGVRASFLGGTHHYRSNSQGSAEEMPPSGTHLDDFS